MCVIESECCGVGKSWITSNKNEKFIKKWIYIESWVTVTIENKLTARNAFRLKRAEQKKKVPKYSKALGVLPRSLPNCASSVDLGSEPKRFLRGAVIAYLDTNCVLGRLVLVSFTGAEFNFCSAFSARCAINNNNCHHSSRFSIAAYPQNRKREKCSRRNRQTNTTKLSYPLFHLKRCCGLLLFAKWWIFSVLARSGTTAQAIQIWLRISQKPYLARFYLSFATWIQSSYLLLLIITFWIRRACYLIFYQRDSMACLHFRRTTWGPACALVANHFQLMHYIPDCNRKTMPKWKQRRRRRSRREGPIVYLIKYLIGSICLSVSICIVD